MLFAGGGYAKIHPAVDRALRGQTETTTVWIMFADKGNVDTNAALAVLETTYNKRAIERRRARRTAPGLFDKRDLPVHDPYVQLVQETGANLRVTSRWCNAVSVEATAAQIHEIATYPFVEQIQPVRSLRPLPVTSPNTAADTPSNKDPLQAGGFYGLSEDQLQQINLIDLHDAGYTGKGVVIGVLDTGFRKSHIAFNSVINPLQIVAEYDFVNDDSETGPEPGDPFNQHNHGSFILGTLAAFSPQTMVGGAYTASYILAKVEEIGSEFKAEEDWFVAGLEFIEANGGDVATSSLTIQGFYSQDELDGMTSVMTIGLNVATANGVHCCQAAGNSGHDANPSTAHLVPAADAFLTLTCGAVDLDGNIAGFSSDGPTADGRVKPELLARGVNTFTIDPSGDDSYTSVSGTSLSTPLEAAAVACLVQAHPDWTVGQMRSALFETADFYVANGTFDPLFVRGFGLLNAHVAWQAEPRATGDLDGDGTVGASDLLILLVNWGPCADCNDCIADLNGDCSVGAADLLILLVNWG
ncbi:MAG: S8 family serine peptidase [Phycisphaerales bacterium]